MKKGLECPDCHEFGSEVKRTHTTPGHIRRRRECTSCGAMYFTSEQVVGLTKKCREDRYGQDPTGDADGGLRDSSQ